MGRTVNWNDVPDTGVVPTGTYQLSIGELAETHSRSGKLMYTTVLTVVAPEEFAGMSVFDNYVIGNDEDPDAAQDQTWNASVAARRMKAVLKASQTPLDADLEVVCAAAIGQQFLASITQETETEGDYKGRIRNRIAGTYPLGHKEVGVDNGAQAAPRSAAPAKATPAKAAPAAAKGIVRPLPAKAAPAPAAAAPKAAAPKASTAMVKCAICQESVTRAEFADHVEAHNE